MESPDDLEINTKNGDGSGGGGDKVEGEAGGAGGDVEGIPEEPDWAAMDLKEGPVVINEEVPLHPEVEKYVVAPDAPSPIDPALQAKKAKEAKKAAEKEAKLKKFNEKKAAAAAAAAASAATTNADKDKKKKDAPGKKPKQDLNQLLSSLKLNKGEKKPLDILPDSYEPKYVEAGWYDWWVEQGFFKPEYGVKDGKMKEEIEKRGKFVMVIPPPNVTGTLHLGHALTCTVEDVLARWHRMSGKVTLWIPGCDHAGIATQTVVEKKLARSGLSRHSLGREEFTNRVWEWKREKGDRIYVQLKRMGISADWERAAFTMDERLGVAVCKAFCQLYEWGFIYRADRLVNWSCTLKSCISDIEVDKVELSGKTLLAVPGYTEKVEFGVLTHFAYKISDSDTEIIVATTRPETMLGDVAIAVHPEDPRYTDLIGQTAKHPFVDRDLAIIADDFVDREFGSGAVKITPAHDPNDYEVGKRHDLEFVTVIDEEGKMMGNCGEFQGLPRFTARTAVITALKKLNLYRDSTPNPMVVPVCSRSKDIVEPLLKPQWYVNCSEMAKQALAVVQEGKLKLMPELHTKLWQNWMEGIRDWCVSRQLWWGHRIPAYRLLFDDGEKEGEEEVWIAAESPAAAEKKALEKYPSKKYKLSQDEDVLDTWFSSALFPFSTLGWPDVKSEDFLNFYPTELLETGHDILFFWVAKMVFMGTTLTAELPFKTVFLHSIVRDAHGRKMSKSLGNVIDPIDVIQGITLAELQKGLEEGNLDPKELEKAKSGQQQSYPQGIPECGTDALRFALAAHLTPHSRDINLEVMRVQGYRFFCNKLWNAVRFTLMYFGQWGYQPSTSPLALDLAAFGRMEAWLLGKYQNAVSGANGAIEKFNFQEATSSCYSFWLYELCDVYLESLKPHFATATNPLSPQLQLKLDVLLLVTTSALQLLHPFMPYITEELWQRLPSFKNETKPPSIVITEYPNVKVWEKFAQEVSVEMKLMLEVVKCIRGLKAGAGLPSKSRIGVFVMTTNPQMKEATKKLLQEEQAVMNALAFTSSITEVNSADELPKSAVEGQAVENVNVYIVP